MQNRILRRRIGLYGRARRLAYRSLANDKSAGKIGAVANKQPARAGFDDRAGRFKAGDRFCRTRRNVDNRLRRSRNVL